MPSRELTGVLGQLQAFREGREEARPGPPVPDLPAVALAAALALDRREDGSGDRLACAPGFEEALLAMGVAPVELRERVPAAGREPGHRRPGVPWSCIRRGFFGTEASPGTLVEVLAGVTFAFRMREEPRVGMVILPGADLTAGAFHEGINLAAVRRCPLVLVVLREARALPGMPSVAAMAPAYGVAADARELDSAGPHPPILEEVTEAAAAAVGRARAGGGVQLLEFVIRDGQEPPSRSDAHPADGGSSA